MISTGKYQKIIHSEEQCNKNQLLGLKIIEMLAPNILSFCRVPDILSLRITCRIARILTHNAAVWKSIVIQNFPTLAHPSFQNHIEQNLQGCQVTWLDSASNSPERLWELIYKRFRCSRALYFHFNEKVEVLDMLHTMADNDGNANLDECTKKKSTTAGGDMPWNAVGCRDLPVPSI